MTMEQSCSNSCQVGGRGDDDAVDVSDEGGGDGVGGGENRERS